MLAQFSMKKKDKKLPGILAEVVPHAASMPLVALLSSSTIAGSFTDMLHLAQYD